VAEFWSGFIIGFVVNICVCTLVLAYYLRKMWP
jgi:hypothetical protein